MQCVELQHEERKFIQPDRWDYLAREGKEQDKYSRAEFITCNALETIRLFASKAVGLSEVPFSLVGSRYGRSVIGSAGGGGLPAVLAPFQFFNPYYSW
jgi:hypothetical protein